MADIPSKSQIRGGVCVSVETKGNQRTGSLTDGTVNEILTSSEFHPHASVMLQSATDRKIKVFLTASSSDALEKDEDWINCCPESN